MVLPTIRLKLSEPILKTVYQGAVRPCLEYGSSAWSTTAKSNRTDPGQNIEPGPSFDHRSNEDHAITEMEKLTSVPPLSQIRDTKIMLQAEKFSSMPNHSMQQRLQNLMKNRLKRSSFIHDSKKLRRQYRDKLPVTTPLTPATLQKPQDALSINLQINTSVPQLLYKDQQSDIMKKALTMSLIAESFPEESWIHVYTDGSAANAVTDVGAGIYA